MSLQSLLNLLEGIQVQFDSFQVDFFNSVVNREQSIEITIKSKESVPPLTIIVDVTPLHSVQKDCLSPMHLVAMVTQISKISLVLRVLRGAWTFSRTQHRSTNQTYTLVAPDRLLIAGIALLEEVEVVGGLEFGFQIDKSHKGGLLVLD